MNFDVADETPKKEVIKKGEDLPGPAPVPVSASAAGSVVKFDEFTAKIDEMRVKAAAHQVVDDKSNEEAVLLQNQTRQLYKAIEELRKDEKAPYLKASTAIDTKANTLKKKVEEIGLGLTAKITPYMLEQDRKRQEAERLEQERLSAERRKQEEEARAQARAEEEVRAKAEREQREREAAEEKKYLDAEDQAKLDEQRKVEEARAEEADKEAAAQAEAEAVAAVPEIVTEVPKELKTKTAAGTATVKKGYDFEILDIQGMPVEFFKARDAQLKKEAAIWIRAQIKADRIDIPGVRVFEIKKVQTRAR